MDIEEIKQDILSKIKWSNTWDPDNFGKTGGQTVSLISRSICLDSEETDFRIFIGATHSQIKNRELALTLFKLYLDEIIR